MGSMIWSDQHLGISPKQENAMDSGRMDAVTMEYDANSAMLSAIGEILQFWWVLKPLAAKESLKPQN